MCAERGHLPAGQAAAGSGGFRCLHGAGGMGGRGWLLLQVRPRACRRLVQSIGMGMDWGKVSCWGQIVQTGNLLPHPRGVIRVYKLVLCSVLCKCKLICCFP